MSQELTLSERIISTLNTDYGIKIATLTQLAIGADLHASTYKAEALDQTSYFIKLKHGHHDTSSEILEFLWSAGIRQIIPPIKTIHEKTTQQMDDLTLIVYPFVEGQDGFNCHLTDEHWVQLGKTLRQVHELDVPPSIQTHIRQETYSAKWRDAIRSTYHHIDSEPVDEIASQLQKFMKKNRGAICRLVDRAEQLGQKLQDKSLECVLCHSDIHGGNVLIDKQSHLYIVDWDEPIIAPKERDLMFIGSGVGNVWNKSLEKKLFYKGYGKTNIHREALAYYRQERIVEDMAIYSREILLTPDGGKSRLEMYNYFIDMFEPNGVVDRAFKADENLLR